MGIKKAIMITKNKLKKTKDESILLTQMKIHQRTRKVEIVEDDIIHESYFSENEYVSDPYELNLWNGGGGGADGEDDGDYNDDYDGDENNDDRMKFYDDDVDENNDDRMKSSSILKKTSQKSDSNDDEEDDDDYNRESRKRNRGKRKLDHTKEPQQQLQRPQRR